MSRTYVVTFSYGMSHCSGGGTAYSADYRTLTQRVHVPDYGAPDLDAEQAAIEAAALQVGAPPDLARAGAGRAVCGDWYTGHVDPLARTSGGPAGRDAKLRITF
jgi:hypothetical protein